MIATFRTAMPQVVAARAIFLAVSSSSAKALIIVLCFVFFGLFVVKSSFFPVSWLRLRARWALRGEV
jgi:hypothetical protein